MSQSPQVRKILVLAANPRDTNQLRLGEEVAKIQKGLERSRHRDRFELTSRWAVQIQDFYRYMLDVEPQIVHFAGHGGGESGIVLEDELGKAQFLGTEQLAGMFKLFARKGVECMLLNACYSEEQAEAICQHVNYVIGMKQAIGDKAAIDFAVTFYDALGAGETVEFAYELGCTRLIGLKDHDIPVLKQRPGMAAGSEAETPVLRLSWTIILEGSTEGLLNDQVEGILSHLRNLGQDQTLKLRSIKSGSIVLELEGTEEGFKIINSLFAGGHLEEVLGLRVRNVSRGSFFESIAESQPRAIEDLQNYPGNQHRLKPAAVSQVDPKEQALKLLRALLPSQFEHVVFKYGVDPADLATNVSQAQTAIAVIRYAEQKEGAALTQLLKVIFEVAPHINV